MSKIRDLLEGRTADFMAMLFPNAKQIAGTWKMGNVLGDQGDSLTVWENGAWKDFATGEKGDLVGLMAARFSISIPEAIAAIETEFLGIQQGSSNYQSWEPDELLDKKMEVFQNGGNPEDVKLTDIQKPKTQAKRETKPIESPSLPAAGHKWLPCPKENPWESGIFRFQGTLSTYTFALADGTIQFLSARMQKGEKKEFRIAHYTPSGWVQKAPDGPRVLFNLPHLSISEPNTPVILVEGEKKCAMAQKALPQYTWVTWHGGVNAIDKYDLKPLEGKIVILWPDNDQPGVEVMNRIIGYLGTRSRVSVIELEPNWNKGDDVADLLNDRGAGYVIAKIQDAIDRLPPGPSEPERIIPQEHTEPNQLGSTYRFCDLYGHEVRYLVEAKDWIYWDGRRWSFDRGSFIWNRLIRTLERTPRDCPEGKETDTYIKASKTTAHLSGIEAGARRMDGIAISENECDKAPTLLNCLNGVVDLESGEIIGHGKDMLMTKLIGVNYERNAKAPIFERLLEKIMCGDKELVEFLQLYFGYSLTGLPPDRIFAIFYGSGRNGKSTLIQIISDILGGYHVAARVQSIMQSAGGSNDKIGEDLIPLRGARLATMQESDKGVRLNEGKIKELTGRDRIKCRYLHSNLWLEWINTAKLILSTNHKPRISGNDSGIWDRVALVPFVYRIPDEEVDPDLPDRILREESEGVLAWMVEGARKFFANGKKLTRPKAIVQATEDYRTDEDVVGRFVAKCITKQDSNQEGVVASALYAEYKSWMADNQDTAVLGSRNFHEAITPLLITLGAQKVRRPHGMYYTGIRILEEGESGNYAKAVDQLGSKWHRANKETSQPSATDKEIPLF